MRKRLVLLSLILIICTNLLLFSAPLNSAEEGYAIQLGVFSNRNLAERLVENLEAKGLETYLLSGKDFRIYTGLFTERSSAEAQLSLARKFVSSAYVVKLSSEQRSQGEEKLKATEQSPTDYLEAVENAEAPEKQVVITKPREGVLHYTYKLQEDYELRGIKGESKWFFEVPKDMKPTAMSFNLFIRSSELIQRDVSYLTVYINNVPIRSVYLKDYPSQVLNSWNVEIPTSRIREGFNELAVRTHTRLNTDYLCEDNFNTANWVVLDGRSYYHLEYKRQNSFPTIADFPRPFIGMYEDKAVGIGIFVPQDYTESEMSAALQMITYLNGYILPYHVRLNLVAGDFSKLDSYDSLIYLGRPAALPSSLQGKINPARMNFTDAHLLRASYKNKPLLLVLSAEGERLLEAVKVLYNQDIKEQMTGNYSQVKTNLDVFIKEPELKESFSLEDIGINGIEVKGLNRQTANLDFRLPANRVLANEAGLKLNLKYSDNLDFEKSLLTVHVNGVPIGSYKLEREKREAHQMSFYLPLKLRNNDYFDIRFSFDLIPDGIINCEYYLYSEPWAYIFEDSEFFFPTTERRIMLLDNLPFPFQKDGDLDSLTVVIPDEPEAEDYLLLGKIAALSGVGLKDNRGNIKAVKAGDFSAEHREDNLILFGSYRRNSLLRQLNKELWFAYNEEGNGFLSNEKIELLPSTSLTATIVELKESPFKEGRGILTISSPDRHSLRETVEYLEDNLWTFFAGDAAIFNPQGDIKNFRFQLAENERPVFNLLSVITLNLREFFLFSGLLLLLLIIGLVLFFSKNRKK